MRQLGKKSRYPGVYRINDNSYRIRAIAIDPRTGRKKAVEKLCDGVSAQEAARQRAELLNEIRVPAAMVQRARVGEFAQSWMKSKALALDEAVARTYSDALDDHILPVFGDLYFDVITKADVQAWVDRSLGTTWRTGKKASRKKQINVKHPLKNRTRKKEVKAKQLVQSYSRNTVHGWFRIFRTMTRDAVDTLELQRDPTLRIRFPPDPEREPNQLTPEEMLRFLDMVKEHHPRQYGLVVMLAFTGLRFCHASALKWEDWDEEVGVIYVKRKQVRGRIGTVSRKKRAPPVVPVTPELADALTLHRQWLMFDKVPNRDVWMFPSAAGTLRTPNTLDRAKQKCLALAGIDRRFTVHGCRYSFTDLTRLAKVDAVTRRALTGHVTEQMQRHYSTVDVAEKREAMQAAMDVLTKAKAAAALAAAEVTRRRGVNSGVN